MSRQVSETPRAGRAVSERLGGPPPDASFRDDRAGPDFHARKERAPLVREHRAGGGGGGGGGGGRALSLEQLFSKTKAKPEIFWLRNPSEVARPPAPSASCPVSTG